MVEDNIPLFFSNDGTYYKSLGGKGKKGFPLNNNELAFWGIISLEVQREICEYKYHHDETVRKELLDSGNKILVHPAMRCGDDLINSRFWEGRAVVKDGKIEILGGNVLGYTWMKIRENQQMEKDE